jgi:hypothetical protein
MSWDWGYFPTYRMSHSTLEDFLKAKFGGYDFLISVGVQTLSRLAQKKF